MCTKSFIRVPESFLKLSFSIKAQDELSQVLQIMADLVEKSTNYAINWTAMSVPKTAPIIVRPCWWSGWEMNPQPSALYQLNLTYQHKILTMNYARTKLDKTKMGCMILSARVVWLLMKGGLEEQKGFVLVFMYGVTNATELFFSDSLWIFSCFFDIWAQVWDKPEPPHFQSTTNNLNE